ncbi:MAG: hypothetical protein AAFR64_10015 [Pseudomonadota bacterium]
MSVFGEPATRYDSIDVELADWADEQGLKWFTEHQDESVRVLVMQSRTNDRVQLYVAPPQGNRFIVGVGRSYPQGGEKFEVNDRCLRTALDKAYAQAKEWAAQ